MSIAEAGAPRVAAERSTRTGAPSTTSTLRRFSLPCEMPAACRIAACSHSSSRSESETSRRGRVLERLDLRLPGRRSTAATRRARVPAVTTSGTLTPACAASNVASASCSTCWSRPDRDGSAAGRDRRAAASVARDAACPARRDRARALRNGFFAAGIGARRRLRIPSLLLLGRMQVGDDDAESGKLGVHALGRRGTPAAVPNVKPDERRGAEAERQRHPVAAEGAERRRAPRPREPRAAISDPARRRAGRTSFGGRRRRARAAAPARRSSGKPQRPSRCSRNGVQSDSTAQPSSIPRPEHDEQGEHQIPEEGESGGAGGTSTTTIRANANCRSRRRGAPERIRPPEDGDHRPGDERVSCSGSVRGCGRRRARARSLRPRGGRCRSCDGCADPASATVRMYYRADPRGPTVLGMTGARWMTDAARRHCDATLYRAGAGIGRNQGLDP